MSREGGSGVVPWIAAGVLAVAWAGFGAMWLFNRRSPPISAPTAYTTFKAADGAFVCAAPQGWSQSGGQAHAVTSGVLFKKGEAKIDITADLAGSLVGDIAAAGNRTAGNLEGMLPSIPGMEIPKAVLKPPVEKLHEADKAGMARKYPNYAEKPMETIRIPYGEGRSSEFTADFGIFGGKVHGYRVTVLGGDRRLTVLCVCPESDWARLQPAFVKVTGSVAAGAG